ncbi:Zn-dependent protease [Mucilaginibacter sp. ZT4R22]|uniref:Zn-dependent protease n=1 Tax=Mucilaginibacter pankratovii TaxID=2772110 RepID=A0ABR7WNJ2_9SPHI|nr:Zn-dependent protease [Mucilaginibacter pankratovii]MBD1363898.1 Zn-dependent protease [Mucilaginibacter pankratovii]
MKKVNPKAILRSAIPLPAKAYYPPRGRYRADSLISYLDNFGSADTVIIGLTDQDISTRNVNITDWGVMGLGFQPGNACVVSTYRLNKAKLAAQFCKLALHELGHTQGLAHCPVKGCFMRDAKGGNHLDEETAFCASCTKFLKSKAGTC